MAIVDLLIHPRRIISVFHPFNGLYRAKYDLGMFDVEIEAVVRSAKDKC